MVGFEENEISIKANGGTEISKRTLADTIDRNLLENFQIVASRIRDLKEDKIRVYWAHDLAEDPESLKLRDENFRNKFHKFVFVSNWQLNQFVETIGIPLDSKVAVIENPVKPFEYKKKEFKDQIRLVYFSTPQRGLEILVPVFEKLSLKYNNVHLDVFSSFKIYGWEETDRIYEPLYDRIRNHPKMTYHGFVDQNTLRQKIQESHILAYPSIWKETSCRVLIESMSAGLYCVHPNLGALPETSGNLTSMYQYQNNLVDHANIFYQHLEYAVEEVIKESAQNYLKFVKTYADSRYDSKFISDQWTAQLNSLVSLYPNIDSRKIPGNLFVYSSMA